MTQAAHSVVFELSYRPPRLTLEMHSFDADGNLLDTAGTVLAAAASSSIAEGEFFSVGKIPDRCTYQRELARRAGLPEVAIPRRNS
jgi:hypothetical protein